MNFLILLAHFVSAQKYIDNEYIVVLKNGPSASGTIDHFEKIEAYISLSNHQSFLQNLGADEPIESEIQTVYDKDVLNGYVGKFDSNVLHYIRSQPEVAFVEKNQLTSINTYNYTAAKYGHKVVQSNAPWGLARISNRKHSNQRQYTHDPSGGQGVAVYVIDTGINIHHVDFEGRAKWGAAMCQGGYNTDTNGHGTHVAGTIAGKTYGVAKKAHVIAVQVFCRGGSGLISDIIRGIQWTVQDFRANSRTYSAGILNLSLGSGYSQASNMALESALASGLLPVVAAGNENQNACNVSPGSSKGALTVGATEVSDVKASFSNYGQCVKIFAPGHQITSAWIGWNTAVNTISGTSMASPHVAGAAAYVASTLGLNDPLKIWDQLVQDSSSNYIRGLDYASPNKLLHI